MSVSVRYFIADEAGQLIPMPQARWHRIYRGDELPPDYAGRDIRCIDAVVEVERRVVRRVVSILPHRVPVKADGHVDVDRVGRRTMEVLGDALHGATTAGKAIRRLEIDASRFWVLTESQWWRLSELLSVSVEDLKAAAHPASPR